MKESLTLIGAPTAGIARILLVDDVVTLGRTAAGCAQLIEDNYPGMDINLFAFVSTESFNVVNKIYRPKIGEIKIYPSGRTFRD